MKWLWSCFSSRCEIFKRAAYHPIGEEKPAGIGFAAIRKSENQKLQNAETFLRALDAAVSM